MFELPASKRVRRADLNHARSSTSPSRSSAHSTPDPELHSQAQARFAALFGDFNLPEVVPKANSKAADQETVLRDEDVNDEDEEEGFEFRLFSNTENKPAARIVLNAEEEDDGDGNFVRKDRDKAYYFATPASGERKAGFENMAVSGETVLGWRNIRARGLEVPWRVKTIKVHSSSKLQVESSTKSGITVEEGDKDRRKCKPNKKRRLILREKQRKKEKAEEERRKKLEGKEEAEREKKTRLNRAKKVKRKMKEKAKKAGDAVGVATADETIADIDMADRDE